MTVDIEVDPDIFLPIYRPLHETKSDIIFLYGGRDSGKTHFIAQELILKCLQADNFRCVLVKKTKDSIKDSQWQTIKDQVEDWGLSEYFRFTVSPLQILCVNGNKFIARGCDDPGNLKSIKDPTDVWYEEGNQLTQEEHTVISTTLRGGDGVRVQEWFSFNPECEGEFTDFWLYKNYFSHTLDYSFKAEKVMDVDNVKIRIKYEAVHSTYKNNPYCTPDRKARHEMLKQISPYYYDVYCLGLWGRRQSGGEFYRCFDKTKHTGKALYNPSEALHFAIDFNVNPYMTGCVWQVTGKEARKIDEILLPHPRNTTLALCSEFAKRYTGHKAGLFLYGDPAGLRQSTADETFVRVKEQTHDEFRKIEQYLKGFSPQRRVPRVYPPVRLRGEFINSVFATNEGGITILFGDNCTHTHSEYSNLKEASDGTKHKEMYKDEVTQVRAQKWGHISDADDYFLTSCFSMEFADFKSGSKDFRVYVGKDNNTGGW